MANDKKLVREITPMDEDFAQWYTDIVKKAELIDYSSMRGCVTCGPRATLLRGTCIWSPSSCSHPMVWIFWGRWARPERTGQASRTATSSLGFSPNPPIS